MRNKDSMFRRVMNVLVGGFASALGIACIANSGLGCFSMTAAYIGLSNLIGVPFSIVNMTVEAIILIYVCFKKEGIGLSSIAATTYVSILIDVFCRILPHNVWLISLGWLTMFGWAITATACLGEGSTQLLTKVLINETGKSVSFIRTIIELVFLIVALLTAREQISWMTIVLTFGTGYILQVFYKLFKFDPANVKHKYIIKLKRKI